MLVASSLLGPYEIIAPLGAGGMGEVYLARDTRLGREVAVKVLPEPFAGNPDWLARFEREARAVAALSHPNILAIHDYGTHGAVTYAVMELLKGETLHSRLATGPLPWREAVEIGAAIAEGLAAAHTKGIVHRDLKPENLFLTADGRVKILDFGLARMIPLPSPQSETGAYAPGLTDPGTVMGTAGYMSPEQVRGQSVDARSDIFSFGCVLYEMVTGQRAFRRGTAAETMAAILHDEPPVPKDSGGKVFAEVERLIRHCLEKHPEGRFQSARDLALALRASWNASEVSKLAQAAPTRWPIAVWATITAVLLALVGGAAFLLIGPGPTPELGRPGEQGKALESVAVLPFENVGGDPALEYLSDGVADHLIYSLSQLRIPDLKVRSFTSVSRYRGQTIDVKAVGQSLGVRALVTGKVYQQGDRLSISVELVDAREDNNVWGDHYQGKHSDILALQDRIAKGVTAHLGLRLTGEDERRLTKRHTSDTEAYLLYRKGRHSWSIRTEGKLKESIDYYNRAIERAPDYALAYAGLADSYSSLGYWGALLPKFAFPRARKAAEQALAIDNALAEAHTSLGYVKLHFEWDWPAAEAAFKRAIELDPKHASAYHWYSHCLIVMGRTEESLIASERALELDPLDRNITLHLAWHYYYVRAYDRAIAQLRSTLETEPNYLFAHHFLALAYVQKKNYSGAIVEAQAAAVDLTGRPAHVALLGYAYGVAGNRSEAQKALGQLIGLSESKRRYVSPYDVAVIYTGLGEKDQALEWLERAYEERSSHLVLLKVEPIFDGLRSDRRFADLLRRVGLQP